MILAADLLPWWFAAAFWLAFVALVLVVARDVRRMGGLRHVNREVRARLAERGDGAADERPEPPGPPGPPPAS